MLYTPTQLGNVPNTAHGKLTHHVQTSSYCAGCMFIIIRFRANFLYSSESDLECFLIFLVMYLFSSVVGSFLVCICCISNVQPGRFGSDHLDVPLDSSMINLGFETKSMTFNKEKIQITVPYTCSSITEQFKVDTELATMAHIHQVGCKAFLVRFSKEADLSVFSVMSTDDADAFNTIWIANEFDKKIEIGFLGSDTTYTVDFFNEMFMSFFMIKLVMAIQNDTSVFTRIMKACEEATTSADP